ncbi:MAG: GtrA family protein [Candidatus Woesearchaeota archaeon]|nr:MAG: GtrA family protein [Candidatus Woesearchaeota archaeon]
MTTALSYLIGGRSMFGNFRKKLFNNLFARFVLVGGVATLVDWTTFYLLTVHVGLYYQVSLFVGLFLGSVTGYALNKTFTFKSKTKQITKQFLMHSSIVAFAFICSGIIMYVFVDALHLPAFVSRIMTTGIIFLLNFILHKYITFNETFYL